MSSADSTGLSQTSPWTSTCGLRRAYLRNCISCSWPCGEWGAAPHAVARVVQWNSGLRHYTPLWSTCTMGVYGGKNVSATPPAYGSWFSRVYSPYATLTFHSGWPKKNLTHPCRGAEMQPDPQHGISPSKRITWEIGLFVDFRPDRKWLLHASGSVTGVTCPADLPSTHAGYCAGHLSP